MVYIGVACKLLASTANYTALLSIEADVHLLGWGVKKRHNS